VGWLYSKWVPTAVLIILMIGIITADERAGKNNRKGKFTGIELYAVFFVRVCVMLEETIALQGRENSYEQIYVYRV